jgi:small subunit ribosomal protein S14
MRASVKRDYKLRKKFLERESQYNKLQSLFQNRYLDGEARESVRLHLAKKGGLLVKVQNRCVISGRSRGTLRKYKVSRINFKELASKGFLVGIKKSSW